MPESFIYRITPCALMSNKPKNWINISQYRARKRLIYEKNNLKIIPQLIRKWGIQIQGRTWSFKIPSLPPFKQVFWQQYFQSFFFATEKVALFVFFFFLFFHFQPVIYFCVSSTFCVSPLESACLILGWKLYFELKTYFSRHISVLL